VSPSPDRSSPRAVRPRRVTRLVCVAVNASVDKIAIVDRLVPGQIHRPELLSAVAGGKPINVARAASRLGLRVVVVPVVAGYLGSWLEASLAREGIDTRPVRVPGETRTCLSILDRSTGSLTEFYEAGPTLDGEGWSAIESAVWTQSRALLTASQPVAVSPRVRATAAVVAAMTVRRRRSGRRLAAVDITVFLPLSGPGAPVGVLA